LVGVTPCVLTVSRMFNYGRASPGPQPVRHRKAPQRQRLALPRLARVAGVGLASLTIACGAVESRGGQKAVERAEHPLRQTHTPPRPPGITSKLGGAVHVVHVDPRLLGLSPPAQRTRAAEIARRTFHEAPPANRASTYIIEFANQADPRPPRKVVQYFFRRAQLEGTSTLRYTAPAYTTVDTVTYPPRLR
jgi:hypothetical protein